MLKTVYKVVRLDWQSEDKMSDALNAAIDCFKTELQIGVIKVVGTSALSDEVLVILERLE